jgi:hypothetical protein
MKKEDKLYFIRFILRTSMFVYPIGEHTVVSFVNGYEAGSGGKSGIKDLLMDHFSERLSIKLGSYGWAGQIRQYAEKKGLPWVTVFKQECLEAFASDKSSLNNEMRVEIKRNIFALLGRIDEHGDPWFNEQWLDDWNTLCLVKRKWFQDLWTASELRALKAIIKEVNTNEAFKQSGPFKATEELLEQKAKFAM